MAAGFAVRGFVRDEAGVPVAGVHVRLHGLGLPIRAELGGNDQISSTSSELGDFELRHLVPAGVWSLTASAAGLRHVAPDKVEVDPVRGTSAIAVTVRRMPSITGVVFDEQGKPVDKVRVAAHLRRSGSVPAARTDSHGAFVMWAVDDEPKPVALAIEPPFPYESQLTSEHAWGAAGLRIVVRRGVEVEVTVAERDSGRPVEAFTLQCLYEGPGTIGSRVRRSPNATAADASRSPASGAGAT